GFLGAFLLDELLRETRAEIHCLVRGKDIGNSRERIERNLRRYGLEPGAAAARIHPVIGDLGRPLLGLSGTDFDRLAADIHVVYPNGAVVHLAFPYAIVRAANGYGTPQCPRVT